MATVNLKEVMEAVQRKIYAADSSTSNLQDLIYLLKAAKRGDGTMVQQVASASVLPDLTDSAADTEMIAFVQDEGKLYFKQDSSGTTVWKTYTPAVVPVTGVTQGSTSGYSSGGSGPPGTSNVIDKFPFSSDANATDVGDLTAVKMSLAGQSSTASGYVSGGYTTDTLNVIEKFPFSSDGNATDVGDLTGQKFYLTGQSGSSSGYTSGGSSPTGTVNVIEKFPFSTDANATDVGDLTAVRYGTAGQNSADNGYNSGGLTPPYTNIIDKFPFATDANATDVGDLTVARQFGSGQSSDVSGYTSGGYNGTLPVGQQNTIDKFSFSSDANATDVGDLLTLKTSGSGQSSTASGYHSGGQTPPGGTTVNIIEKFPFSSDANSTDVGDLTAVRYHLAGQQV